MSGEEFLGDCEADVMAAYEAWKLRLSERGSVLERFDTEFWDESKEIFMAIQASEAAELASRALRPLRRRRLGSGWRGGLRSRRG